LSYLEILERLIAKQEEEGGTKLTEREIRDKSEGRPRRKLPSWYTKEDRKANLVLQGFCRNCLHLWFAENNDGKNEFHGLWCAMLGKKLEDKVESCREFKDFGNELERLIEELGIRASK